MEEATQQWHFLQSCDVSQEISWDLVAPHVLTGEEGEEMGTYQEVKLRIHKSKNP
jgi:hypothetical protein